eukprot:GDKH01007226.1.p1 GENE.GDKH01007226.1~~GDKH01007226.1.p1  ORF type:complete len:281 (+),score=66.69 GDKH01007226.1:120-962(+)
MDAIFAKEFAALSTDEDQLTFDGLTVKTFQPTDGELFKKFPKVEFLSLIACDIASLDNFPTISGLRHLLLSDNHIKGGLDKLVSMPELETLYLGGNHLKSLSDLEPLKQLSHLKKLELTYCPVSEVEGYPQNVWDMLPSLKVLDGKDREGKDVEDDDDDEESDESEPEVAQEDEGDFADENDVEDDDEGIEKVADPNAVDHADLKGFYSTEFAEDDDEDEGDFEPGDPDAQDEDFEDESEDDDENDDEAEPSSAIREKVAVGVEQETTGEPAAKRQRLDA